MTVHFIGAGPGAPDLLTLRGRDLIAAAPVVLYAGSLVPKAVIAHAPAASAVVPTKPRLLRFRDMPLLPFDGAQFSALLPLARGIAA